jgi:outer membrane protein OmpA-like peptidoglycan-associated protein
MNLTKAAACLFCLLLLIPVAGRAQAEEDFPPSLPKKAKIAYLNAVDYYQNDDLASAEKELLKALAVDSTFATGHYFLGEVYLETSQYDKAAAHYCTAIRLEPDQLPEAYYLAGKAEFMLGRYEEAVAHLEAYLQQAKKSLSNRKKAGQYLRNAKFASEAVKHPVPFKPVNLGPAINTDANEYFPCLTADNQTLLFTRLLADRRSATGRQEDFFMSKKQNGSWSRAAAIGLPINTANNEGAPTLSADGNILFFIACENVYGYGEGRQGLGSCDIFRAERMGDGWMQPENIGEPVNSRNWESQPSFSSDGKTLYFVSNRGGGYNIWQTTLEEDGLWSEPVKLGPNINTDADESSVFIHPDNRTLYFSSNGHPGMGGMDIFMSKPDSTGDWGKPVNLGYPINTSGDDNCLSISSDGTTAFFASDREGGYGGLDIYSFELYEEVRPEKVNYMKGVVFDAETREKLRARFELIDLKTGKVAVESHSNPGNGEFLVCLPGNTNYALNVSRDGYLFFSENFSLTGNNPSSDPFLKDVPLHRIRTGEKVVMKNIFFETDKYDLLPESLVELGKLAGFLKKNPDIRIEISGHTDNVGTPAYNQTLSENRARAVYDYLVRAGLDPGRLAYKGLGLSQPIDTNDTEQGRANNRRTEFRITEF